MEPPLSIKTDHSARIQLEVERSAAEASKIVLRPVEVDRYLDPPKDTPFPLEYAFYLLGDVRGKTVFDMGCGSGETIIPLVRRGAQVNGIDISPELIAFAQRRLKASDLSANVRVGSAYETGMPDGSVDVVFCMYKTGYDPQAFVSFFEKLQAKEKKKPGTLAKAFSTHPQTPDRIEKSQEEIGKILPARPQYVVSTSEFDDVKSRLAVIENRRKVVDEKDNNKPSLRRTTTSDKTNTDKDGKDKDDDRPTLKRREDQN